MTVVESIRNTAREFGVGLKYDVVGVISSQLRFFSLGNRSGNVTAIFNIIGNPTFFTLWLLSGQIRMILIAGTVSVTLTRLLSFGLDFTGLLRL